MKLTKQGYNYTLRLDLTSPKHVKERLELLGLEVKAGGWQANMYMIYTFKSKRLITTKDILAIPENEIRTYIRMNLMQEQLDAIWKIIEEEVEILKKRSHDHWWSRRKKRVIRHQ